MASLEGSLLNVPRELLKAPAGLFDRGRAVFSENREPGFGGALKAIADPEPTLQRDAMQQFLEADPQFADSLEAAASSGDVQGYRKAVMRKMVMESARTGQMPEIGKQLFQAANFIEQQSLDASNPLLGRSITANAARMGDPRMVTAGANAIDAESAAQRRTDQTSMEQGLQPSKIAQNEAAALSSRANAAAQNALAGLYRERGITEEMLRDPQFRELDAKGREAGTRAAIANLEFENWQRDFDSMIRGRDADAYQARQTGRQRRADAIATSAKAPSEIAKNEGAAARDEAAARFYSDSTSATYDPETGLTTINRGGTNAPSPAPTTAPTTAPQSAPSIPGQGASQQASQPVDAQGQADAMMEVLGPDIAPQLLQGKNVSGQLIRQRLAERGVTDPDAQTRAIASINQWLRQQAQRDSPLPQSTALPTQTPGGYAPPTPTYSSTPSPYR